MRALVCTKLGGPQTQSTFSLSVEEDHPRPQASSLPPGAVRIRVAAASLNYADVLQVQGLYQDRASPPFVPGSEVSGTVTEVGSNVRHLAVEDQVIAVTRGGAFAEEVVADAGGAFPLPPGADLEAAAGLPVAFGTAHLALAERARLRAGQTVCVLGAAGGVGMAAVQVSRLLGARVVAVCRGSEKAAALRDLGAAAVVDTAAGDAPLRQRLKEAAPQGVDVLFDTVGGAQFEAALRACRWGAHVLFIGFASGKIPTGADQAGCWHMAANLALVKNLTLHGVFWGSYLGQQPRTLQRGLAQLLAWLREGRLRIPVHRRYALEQAQEAFLAMSDRKVLGKVLIIPSQRPSKL